MDERTAPEKDFRRIGHDMRNALHSISAGMGIISKTNTDPGLAPIIDLMAEAVENMRCLVSELNPSSNPALDN
ncbi:hypothetical protein LJR030_002966 [Rhizobium sp. LjRoot30]|uniref:hypothetical protein n=1 Tax=Rhizobium sp. LjRoot30 TaxID=3342320 RepID=UPI003ED07C88